YFHVTGVQTCALPIWGGGPSLTRSNIAGYDDELSTAARFTEGLNQFEVRERIPLNRFDTEFIASYQFTESEVVEPSLEFLDIQRDRQSVVSRQNVDHS